MAKVIDLTESDGDLVILGRSLVLPSSETDSTPAPLNGAMRFNPTLARPQLFVEGVWITLGAGSGGSGGSDNNHTHAISQIQGLANALNNRAPLVHTHELTEVNGLVAALAQKAPTAHGHTIAQVTGLETALAGKANTLHGHNYTVNEHISACLPGNPPALFRLVYTTPVTCVLPANLVGSFVRVITNPAATFVIELFKNGTTAIGNITILPTGTIQFNFAADVAMVAGDTLSFQLPARDTALNTVSLSIVARRQAQQTT